MLIEDLGSANGTYVNGDRVERAACRPGDELRFGSESLSWGDPALRPFLRGGARGDTVVGVPVPKRRFICGACGHKGQLPVEAPGVQLKCGRCGATLALGVGPTKRPLAIWGLAAATAVLAVVLVFGLAVRPGGAFGSGTAKLGFAADAPEPASPQEASIRVHSVGRLLDALDASHPLTRNAAAALASEDAGPFSVEQVAAIWSHVKGEWRYVNDPRTDEYFAKASESIANNYVGDCDDFSIVLSAMVSSIGGEARVVMMDGPEGGHAYAEACVNQAPDTVAARLAKYYRKQRGKHLKVERIHFRSSPDCPVWLNLDWNANVPGGAYTSEDWAVAVYEDGRTETLAPAKGPADARASGPLNRGTPEGTGRGPTAGAR